MIQTQAIDMAMWEFVLMQDLSQTPKEKPSCIAPRISAGNLRLQVRVGGRLQHAALSRSVVVLRATAQEDVSLVAPRRAPRVLDLVVIISALGSIAYSKDAVVELGSACAGEDSGGVQLEVLLVGLDGDRHGLLGQCIHHGTIRVLLHVGVALGSRGGHLVAGGLLASASLAGSTRRVRVVGLSTQATILAGPGKGVVHETTIASHVGSAGLPWRLSQSTRFCSEREIRSPPLICRAPSRAPVVEKDQQEPHWPWSLTGVTAPSPPNQCWREHWRGYQGRCARCFLP